MSHIGFVTLSIANADPVFYLLMPPSDQDRGGNDLNEFRETFSAENEEDLFYQIVTWIGFDSPKKSEVIFEEGEDAVWHYHFNAPKRHFNFCLPSDHPDSIAASDCPKFVSCDDIISDGDLLLHGLIDEVKTQLLASMREPGGGMYDRAGPWSVDKAGEGSAGCDEANDSQPSWGVVPNPKYLTPTKRAFSDHLKERGDQCLSGARLTPGGSRFVLSNEGGKFRVAFNLGPFSTVIREGLQLNASGQLVEARGLFDAEPPIKVRKNSDGMLHDQMMMKNKMLLKLSGTKPKFIRLQRRFTVTAEKIARSRREKTLNGRRRLTSQKACFGGVPANEAVARHFSDELDPDQLFEYGHMIYHGAEGEDAQVSENLVLMTKHCNTLMMFIEMVITILAIRGHRVDLNVVALVSNETEEHAYFHVAERIIYQMTIDDCPSLTFEFDPLRTILKPPRGLLCYVWACVDAVLSGLDLGCDMMSQILDQFPLAKEEPLASPSTSPRI